MGYTHYWYRKDKEIKFEVFGNIMSDFQRLLSRFEELGIQLADGCGKGKPVVEKNLISFNGRRNCGHPSTYEVGIAWPSKDAGGIANPWVEDVRTEPWLGGAIIEKRVCSGDCSHETCCFPRMVPKDAYGYFEAHPMEEDGKGWQLEFCKTAYKPYDLAVTAFLIIVKHHIGEKIWVRSDGISQHWADGRVLCQQVLGYGVEFELDR